MILDDIFKILGVILHKTRKSKELLPMKNVKRVVFLQMDELEANFLYHLSYFGVSLI
jgi:hypothetical protein